MRYTKRRLLLGLAQLLLLASLSLSAHAEIPFTGRVTIDGHGVADIRVTLHPKPAPFNQDELYFNGRAVAEPVAEAKTQADGTYRLNAPEIGTWRIRIAAAGYQPLTRILKPTTTGLTLPDATLKPATTARIRVRDANDQPVEARVLAYPFKELRNIRRPADDDNDWILDLRVSQTNANGVARFRWSDDYEGKYFVRAVADGYAPAEESLRSMPVGGIVDLKLKKVPSQQVLVQDATGRPAPNVLIRVGMTRLPLARTNDQGEASLYLNERASLHLRDAGSRYANWLLLPASADTPQQPVTITLQEPVQVTGRVVERETRRPIANAFLWTHNSVQTRTDRSGGYNLRIPAEATPSNLNALAQGFVADNRSFDIENAPNGPTLALIPSANIGGFVRDSDGNPLEGVEVTLGEEEMRFGVSMAIMFSRGRFSDRFARTGPDGRFEILGLPAGRGYALSAEMEGKTPTSLPVSKLAPGEDRRDLEIVLEAGRQGTGLVLDENDTPIAGATAKLLAKQNNPFGQPQAEAEGTSNERGEFTLSNLKAGVFDLHVEAADSSPLIVRGIEIPKGPGHVDLGTVVLSPGQPLTGRVTGSAGEPLAGAEIRVGAQDSRSAMMPPDILKMILPRQSPKATTDAQGQFNVTGLIDGKVNLHIRAEGFVDEIRAAVVIPAEEALQIEMEPAARILGRVLDDNGQPFADARVRFGKEGERMSFGNAATSAADGTFELDGAEPGRVTIEATATGYKKFQLTGLQVPEDGDLKGVELILSPGAVLEGTVFGPDQSPAIDAMVYYGTGSAQPRFTGMSRTDGDGRYRIAGLDVGNWTVTAEHEIYQKTSRDFEVRQGQNAYRVDLNFKGGMEVSGRVLGPEGQPLGGALVSLKQQDMFFSVPQTQSNPDGSFTIRGALPGEYTPQATLDGYGTALGEPIVLADQGLSNLELRLPRSATLTGAILGLNNNELTQAIVSARSQSSTEFKMGTVDYQGRYEVQGLSPGDWTVTAGAGYSSRQETGIVTIDEASNDAVLDLEFQDGYTLTGRVENGQGEPIAGIMVTLQGPGTRRWATTDANGQFETTGLETGTYELRVSSMGNSTSYQEEIELLSDENVNIVLRTARLSGSIRNGFDGSPIVGARVRVETVDNNDGPTFSRQTSDARGLFSLSGVTEGSWRLVAERSGFARAEKVVDVTGQPLEDIELEMMPTEGVYLTVSLATGGAPGTVNAAVLRGDQRLLGGRFNTTEGGGLRLAEVPEGRFELLLSAPGYATHTMTVDSPGQAGNVELALAGRLTVTVPALTDDPKSFEVEVLDGNGQPYRWMGGWNGQMSAKQMGRHGRLEIEGVAEGNWTIRATMDDQSWTANVGVRAGETVAVELR